MEREGEGRRGRRKWDVRSVCVWNTSAPLPRAKVSSVTFAVVITVFVSKSCGRFRSFFPFYFILLMGYPDHTHRHTHTVWWADAHSRCHTCTQRGIQSVVVYASQRSFVTSPSHVNSHPPLVRFVFFLSVCSCGSCSTTLCAFHAKRPLLPSFFPFLPFPFCVHRNGVE